MAKVCLCLTGKTIGQNLEILNKYRKYADIAEFRVDCLDPDERFQIRQFPEQAGMPVILTIRREADGGFFSGGEGSRITLFSKGLAYAEADRRKNFAYLDIEEDLDVPSLEEAARTFGTRIIRSFHNLGGVDKNLADRMDRLRHVGDEIVKAAVFPRSLADTLRIYREAGKVRGDKIILGMGHFGTNTRILAEKLGSCISYVSVKDEADLRQGAPGQLDPKELVDLYRFKKIRADTMSFGILGYPLHTTSSPLFFNRVFMEENINAVYIPFPADTLESFFELADELKLQGVSVTVPYKEQVLPLLTTRSEKVSSVGACNTMVRTPEGWMGYNTDSRGFSDSLLEFIGKKNLAGKRISIIGAGGVARAAASEVFRLKGKALIVNRTLARAKRLAQPYKFACASADPEGAEMMRKYSDIIIQTTSVGMAPDITGDPIPDYNFTGKEKVMDLIYKPETTVFLKRAAAAGCPVINGNDMLIRQAIYQYQYFIGAEFPAQLRNRIDLTG
ncbi:MAG: type I 3-dehydroquinate dehydratase [Treponema sp.]|jgi:3-dehydroquinate dehydratase/shikimate dehydrogenase|nr:type I 3-dehydroquinate dehydratase [Treponema sp.]